MSPRTKVKATTERAGRSEAVSEGGSRLAGVRALMRAQLSEAEQLEWDRLEHEEAAVATGQAAPLLSFREFVDRIKRGKFRWYWHALVLAAVLQRVADGQLKRVMVFMPPRHGKSEEISRLFTAYWLYRFPEQWVALVSYGADLAETHALEARSNWEAFGGRLKRAEQNVRKVKEWHTGKGGGMIARGMGGALTGYGFHLGIIDDPTKDDEEARSLKIQRRNQNWYPTTFASRAEPGAAIVILMTRWHVNDLAGWLLAQEYEAPEHWHIVAMPAIKPKPEHDLWLQQLAARDTDAAGGSSGPLPFGLKPLPATVTMEPDPREPGTPLAPDRYDAADLEKKRRPLTNYQWQALYQQFPIVQEGGLFARDMFQRITRAELFRLYPSLAQWLMVRWHDLSASRESGDWTAGLLQVRFPDKRHAILGLLHGQWHPGERDKQIRLQAEADDALWGRGRIVYGVEQEPASGGIAQVDAFRQMLGGRPVVDDKPGSDKVTRANPAAAHAESKLFYILDEPFADTVLSELEAFGPGAAVDDIVDALSGGFNYLAAKAERMAQGRRAGTQSQHTTAP